MTEAAKKILAYQQTPLIVTCTQSGELPEDFLVSLTQDEQEYAHIRGISALEPIFYELLPRIGAAGVLSAAPPLLIDVHQIRPRIFATVDGIAMPLAEDPSTQKFLVQQFFEPYQEELRKTIKKTQQRFGQAHAIHISILPQFMDDKLVEHDVVTFGKKILPGAEHEPQELQELYEGLFVATLDSHTWIGVNKKLFATHTLRKELVERLARMKVELVAQART